MEEPIDRYRELRSEFWFGAMMSRLARCLIHDEPMEIEDKKYRQTILFMLRGLGRRYQVVSKGLNGSGQDTLCIKILQNKDEPDPYFWPPMLLELGGRYHLVPRKEVAFSPYLSALERQEHPKDGVHHLMLQDQGLEGYLIYLATGTIMESPCWDIFDFMGHRTPQDEEDEPFFHVLLEQEWMEFMDCRQLVFAEDIGPLKDTTPIQEKIYNIRPLHMQFLFDANWHHMSPVAYYMRKHYITYIDVEHPELYDDEMLAQIQRQGHRLRLLGHIPDTVDPLELAKKLNFPFIFQANPLERNLTEWIRPCIKRHLDLIPERGARLAYKILYGLDIPIVIE